MAKITYTGAHRGGIHLPVTDQYVAHGETVDVPKALADELCARTELDGTPQWTPAAKAASTSDNKES